MSLLIGDNAVVSIHYTLTDSDGAVIDSSEGAGPLNYLHGAGNIIPGLEKALVGKTTGANLQVTVPAAEGYGEVQPELVQQVPLSAFQGIDSIEPGMAFEAQDAQGNGRRVVVKSVDDEVVVVDGNHPLAGVDLNFKVEVVDIRDATEEEIAHGHVH
jgi:FKBP-type peptidyl-prolyl cis-trans isomerase SlyD